MAGLAGEYLPYELSADGLEAHLFSFAAQGGRGLNVTIPYKVAILPHLDWISPEARMLGAVNTIVFEHSPSPPSTPLLPQRKGYNTDITGFIRSLPESVLTQLPSMHVLLLGAGGSARAVAAGLIQQGVARLTLALRNPEKAADFIAAMSAMKQFYQTQTHLDWVTLDAIAKLPNVQGIINTTPVGMWPETQASPLPLNDLRALLQNQTAQDTVRFIYDLIYRPLETQLMRHAIESGYCQDLLAINGLDMLIHQGLAAFELWAFDKESSYPLPPDTVDILRTHLQEVLTQ